MPDFDSTASPTTPGLVPVPVTVDTAAVRELLGAMKVNLNNLRATFHSIDEQSDQVSSLGPNMNMVFANLNILRQQMSMHEGDQKQRIATIESALREEVKVAAAEDIREYMRKTISAEVTKQAKQQIKLQTKEVVPVSLPQQIEESKRLIEQTKVATANSEARRTNSGLGTTDLTVDLAVVLRPNGQKSKLYPTNLQSLFAYTPDKVKELMKEFGLFEHAVLEDNFNRFMSFIGITDILLAPISQVQASTTRKASSK